MKKTELQKLIREEAIKIIKEKINFSLGAESAANPDKPMKDNFQIVFKDARKAEQILMKINDELKSQGLQPIQYENQGFVFKKPTYNQFSAVLDKFSVTDVEEIGRMIK